MNVTENISVAQTLQNMTNTPRSRAVSFPHL